MKPTAEERLARIREVSDRALQYFATAYLNTDPAEQHVIAERDLLKAYMTEVANVITLLDEDALDDRSMMSARHAVIDKYLELARSDPWIPPGQQEKPTD